MVMSARTKDFNESEAVCHDMGPSYLRVAAFLHILPNISKIIIHNHYIHIQRARHVASGLNSFVSDYFKHRVFVSCSSILLDILFFLIG